MINPFPRPSFLVPSLECHTCSRGRASLALFDPVSQQHFFFNWQTLVTKLERDRGGIHGETLPGPVETL